MKKQTKLDWFISIITILWLLNTVIYTYICTQMYYKNKELLTKERSLNMQLYEVNLIRKIVAQQVKFNSVSYVASYTKNSNYVDFMSTSTKTCYYLN